MLPGTELTAQDCLYMGKHSFNLGLYLRAIQWFEEAYTLAGHEGNVTITQEQVNLFLNTAIKSVSRSNKILNYCFFLITHINIHTIYEFH